MSGTESLPKITGGCSMADQKNRPRLLITGKAYDPHIGGIETVM